ncbi:hypothetical protein [Flavobacterium frigoris]|uniref:Uncharacterized protein n=1 Tax=Flavobacterium frigoris TaxID=229204 RepID=A0A1H9R4P1_FLAFI|nr:hypothetical protein [Flavobacterium frigoris]SER67660.1 hypothetical protein SAMN05444355_11917 [Flavobacterium frigoris]
MTKKAKFHKVASNFSVCIWTVLGLLTIGSIINGDVGLLINIFIGLIFIVLAYYLFLKKQNISVLISHAEYWNGKDLVIEKTFNRFLILENVLVVMQILVGIILLSAVISRVIGEKVPVFG